MSYKSMLILLQEELTTCQQLGTSVKERKSGLKVGIKPLDDKEIVLFFKTDHAFARKCLQMPESDKKSCDYLALYLRECLVLVTMRFFGRKAFVMGD